MEYTNKNDNEINKQLASMKNYAFAYFLDDYVKDGDKFIEEIKKFNMDFKKYRTGVFLCFDKKYPNFLEFINKFSEKKITFDNLVLGEVEAVVKEYYKFISDVKNSSQFLLEIELKESEKFVFNKTIRPINIIIQKNAVLSYLTIDLSKNIHQYSTPILDLIKKYMPKIQKEVDFIVDIFKPIIFGKFDLILKLFKGEITPEKFMDIITKQDKYVISIREKLKHNCEILAKMIENERIKICNDSAQSYEAIENVTKIFTNAYKEQPTKIIYDYLLLIKDIDSFNIEFIKFLNRLYHILNNQNRQYQKYYRINKNVRGVGNKLKDFLSNDLSKSYPNLASFLLKIFDYYEFRNIDAHEIPNIIRLSEDKKVAYIPKTGNIPDSKMDIDDIKRIINSYCFFIDATGI